MSGAKAYAPSARNAAADPARGILRQDGARPISFSLDREGTRDGARLCGSDWGRLAAPGLDRAGAERGRDARRPSDRDALRAPPLTDTLLALVLLNAVAVGIWLLVAFPMVREIVLGSVTALPWWAWAGFAVVMGGLAGGQVR